MNWAKSPDSSSLEVLLYSLHHTTISNADRAPFHYMSTTSAHNTCSEESSYLFGPPSIHAKSCYTHRPPSTSIFTPVINTAFSSSLAKWQQVFATSAGVDGRPRGTVETKAARFSGVSGLPRDRCVLGSEISHGSSQTAEQTNDGRALYSHACAANDGENSIEMNLMWSIFNGQRLGRRNNDSLGRIVPRQLGKGPYASRGGSLDEAAWAVLLQKEVLRLAFVTSASTRRPHINAEAVDFPDLL